MMSQFAAVEVITLFVKDLTRSRAFYDAVFQAEVVMEDDQSSVLNFGSLMINLLVEEEAPTLIEPLAVALTSEGSRFMFTIKVDDFEEAMRELKAQNVELLNGPIDRPWGRRTAAFADPDGHAWEIAADLPTIGE
jgi:catechol 2,3-dioxygenase-like lactoylglutathione lyase family enzyme